MKYTVTYLHNETITAARRRHDGNHTDVTRTVRTPIAERAIDAADMTAARRAARAAAVPFEYDEIRVNYDAAADVMTAARYAAYSVLKMTYSRQCADFIRAAMDSIAARRPNDDADDVISECAAAMVDSDAAARTVGEYAARIAPNYAAFRAAYVAANRYIDGMRRREITTARQDIMHYVRATEDRADADAAAEYDAGYLSDMDTDAFVRATERDNYLSDRRATRDAIMTAMSSITPKQAAAVRAYAATNSMRAAAELIGVKNQSTVARHIAAARAAMLDMPNDDTMVDMFRQSDARRAERARAVVDRAAMTAAAYDMPVTATAERAIDAARAAYVVARRHALDVTARARAAVDAHDDSAARLYDAARAACKRARAAAAEYADARAAYVAARAANGDMTAARALIDAERAARAAMTDADARTEGRARAAAYDAACKPVDHDDARADADAIRAIDAAIRARRAYGIEAQAAARAAAVDSVKYR